MQASNAEHYAATMCSGKEDIDGDKGARIQTLNTQLRRCAAENDMTMTTVRAYNAEHLAATRRSGKRLRHDQVHASNAEHLRRTARGGKIRIAKQPTRNEVHSTSHVVPGSGQRMQTGS